MAAAFSSEISKNFYQTTWRRFPVSFFVHRERCEAILYEGNSSFSAIGEFWEFVLKGI
jgi:hypothetical protein